MGEHVEPVIASRMDAISQVNAPRQAHAVVLADHLTVEISAPKVADSPEVEHDAPICIPAISAGTVLCGTQPDSGRLVFKLARAMRHAHALPAVGRRVAVGDPRQTPTRHSATSGHRRRLLPYYASLVSATKVFMVYPPLKCLENAGRCPTPHSAMTELPLSWRTVGPPPRRPPSPSRETPPPDLCAAPTGSGAASPDPLR